MADTEWLERSVVDLVARVRAGDVSPVELTEAHIARIEAVNPTLNAVVAPRFEAALDEARAAEQRLTRRSVEADEDLGALFGIPCTIKEFLGVEGMPNTIGLVSRRDHRAERDASVVRRVRDAGAIVLGLTNAPEGGMSAETHNLVYGRTVNPWDTTRTCGGSSGGEGAIITSGGSPFGIGSDIAGSVRTPASMCGITAHKPTGRRVPNTGHAPLPTGEVAAFLCCGPMARRVEDLATVLEVIEGPDGEDPLTRRFPSLAEAAGDVDDLSDVTVFPVPTSGRVPLHPECRAAVWQVTRALEERGARVDTSLADAVKNVFLIWAGMMLEAAEDRYADVLAADGEPLRLGRELWRLARGRSNHTAAIFPMLLFERLGDLLPIDASRAGEPGRRLRDRLEATLGPRGVIVHPSWPFPAPRHNGTLTTPLHVAYAALFSVLEFPATQVPVRRFADGGLPLGVQIAAGRGRDGLTLRVARAVEATFGGWQLCNPVE